VPLHTGAAAGALAETHVADGIATGAGVFLGGGYGEDTPAGVGLIAHELLHSGRRAARFVAPASSDTGSEEQAAEWVERAAARVARARLAQPPPVPAQPAVPEALPAAPPASAPAGATAAPGASPIPGATPPRNVWGALPAPWEPLPAAPPLVSPPVAAALPPQRSGVAADDVQRADLQRSLAAQQAAAAVGPATPATIAPAAPEADIDALAHEVYARIRRRLAAERRRGAT
jgi:hypothetical protein